MTNTKQTFDELWEKADEWTFNTVANMLIELNSFPLCIKNHVQREATKLANDDCYNLAVAVKIASKEWLA